MNYAERLKRWNFNKRYARARNRIEAGFHYHGHKNIQVIHLTTKQGTDNTWKRLREDVKKVMRTLRGQGYTIDYTFCPDVSPSKGLVHAHGLVRSKPFLTYDKLSDLWAHYHNGSFMVFVQGVNNEEALTKYIIKHMLKTKNTEQLHGGRIIYSLGWLPQGWNKVRKGYVKNAIELIDDGVDERKVWQIFNNKFFNFCKQQGEKVNNG